MANLGPGSTWERVLNIIDPDRFTVIHGQCLTVGVGGYLLGGGINMGGATHRYGTGAQNVLQYRMVTADGDVVVVNRDNVTSLHTVSGL